MLVGERSEARCCSTARIVLTRFVRSSMEDVGGSPELPSCAVIPRSHRVARREWASGVQGSNNKSADSVTGVLTGEELHIDSREAKRIRLEALGRLSQLQVAL
mmetsp:Transcript_40187/g.106375  ORF Transcript_40187/g.106375 Transcript_40187/m.106375 type:complete len:103 (-) Transcript_40187:180-488(-)